MNVMPFVPAPLGIEVSFPSSGVARIALAGEIDMVTGPLVGMRLYAVMQQHHPAVMEIDLAAVTFLDCAGLGLFVAARNAAAASQCQLWVTHPQGLVERVLVVTGMLASLTAPDAAAPSGRNRWRPRLRRMPVGG